MDTDENIEAVLPQLIAGDEESWEKLYQQFWPLVSRIAATIMRDCNQRTVENAAHYVFSLLADNGCRRLRRYDPERGDFHKYIAVITRSAVRDYLRHHKKFDRHVDISAIPEPTATDTSIAELFAAEEVTAALQALTERERAVIEMLVLDGLKSEEVASRLNITRDTVRSLKSHAMPKLKKYFRKD